MQNEKQKFKEDFIKRLVKFTVSIINFAEEMKQRRVLWPVADQLVRSAGSIGANIVEAKGSSSNRDYTRFFEIALKSANETKYWLTVVKESSTNNIASQSQYLYQEADEISRIIGSSILTLKGKRI